MKIVCVVCPEGAPEIPEAEYPSHMQSVHEGKSQADLIKKSKEILPIDVDPTTLPSAEFMELAKEIDSKPVIQDTPKPPSDPPPKPKEQPVKLTYQYIGTHNGHPIQTLELDVDGKHFVVAYDSVDRLQVESREVANLNPQALPTITIERPQIITIEVPIEKSTLAETPKEKPKKEVKR